MFDFQYFIFLFVFSLSVGMVFSIYESENTLKHYQPIKIKHHENKHNQNTKGGKKPFI